MSKNICALPWTHLNFYPNGDVYPCCLTIQHGEKLGNLNHQTVEEIWNGDSMKSLRMLMLDGMEPKSCNICFDRESKTGQSARLFYNREFKNVLTKIPQITNKDGSVKVMELKYWDFRFSNLCNFKCRSCTPDLSSSWIPDARELGYKGINNKTSQIIKINDSHIDEFIDKNIEQVEKIYFAGGEPLLMDEHWYILNLLVRLKKFNVKLYYNTNLSNLAYKNQKILDMWKLWPAGKIEICPSIDEIGERSELIRCGTNWNIIKKNLIDISRLENILIKPCITVSVFNASRILNILDYLIDLKIINEKSNYKNFHLNLLQSPEYYHVSILSKEHKKLLLKELESYINLYQKIYKTDIRDHFSYFLKNLVLEKDEITLKEFREITKKLDNLRKENTAETIPEIAYLLNTC